MQFLSFIRAQLRHSLLHLKIRWCHALNAVCVYVICRVIKEINYGLIKTFRMIESVKHVRHGGNVHDAMSSWGLPQETPR